MDSPQFDQKQIRRKFRRFVWIAFTIALVITTYPGFYLYLRIDKQLVHRAGYYSEEYSGVAGGTAHFISTNDEALWWKFQKQHPELIVTTFTLSEKEQLELFENVIAPKLARQKNFYSWFSPLMKLEIAFWKKVNPNPKYP